MRRVLSDGAAILINEADNNADLKTESLIAARSRSVLCVPLIMHDRKLGVIYLDSDEPQARFDENHLQMVTAVAAIAAVAIHNARNFEDLENENARLMVDADIEHNMVGESPLLQRVYQLISKVAPTDSTVLIFGESGTGKELAARAIHRNSKRGEKPFIAVKLRRVRRDRFWKANCSATKRALSPARYCRRRDGLSSRTAARFFLMRSANCPLPCKRNCCVFCRSASLNASAGPARSKSTFDCWRRPIAISKTRSRQAAFRQDLYFRLNVVKLTMPPLRERREDIPLLANYFARKYAEKCNRRVMGISSEARKRLMTYDWPGNVRELENAIERAVVLGTTEQILADDLPEAVVEAEATVSSRSSFQLSRAVVQTKKRMITDAMKQANGNYTAAAKLLDLHPNYLHRLIRNLNMKDELKA